MGEERGREEDGRDRPLKQIPGSAPARPPNLARSLRQWLQNYVWFDRIVDLSDSLVFGLLFEVNNYRVAICVTYGK